MNLLFVKGVIEILKLNRFENTSVPNNVYEFFSQID